MRCPLRASVIATWDSTAELLDRMYERRRVIVYHFESLYSNGKVFLSRNSQARRVPVNLYGAMVHSLDFDVTILRCLPDPGCRPLTHLRHVL